MTIRHKTVKAVKNFVCAIGVFTSASVCTLAGALAWHSFYEPIPVLEEVISAANLTIVHFMDDAFSQPSMALDASLRPKPRPQFFNDAVMAASVAFALEQAQAQE